MKRIGAATALEVRATGIPYTFAPCIAVKKTLQQNSLLVGLICFKSDNSVFFLQVCRDPRWGRCYESYSEDHKIVQAMTEIIPGLQGDIPANSRKGVPFVAGKYEILSPCTLFFSAV